jgi:ubiquinone/menaquinone biosynthesis C-methylase UbiE
MTAPELQSKETTVAPTRELNRAVVETVQRTKQINTLTVALRFLTLAVVIAEIVLAVVLLTHINSEPREPLLVSLMLSLTLILIAGLATAGFFWPESLYIFIRNKTNVQTTPEIVRKRLETSEPIAFEDNPPPLAGVWYKEIRPVLHEAIQYTVPTYYLDANLMIVDWNLAFGLVFSKLGSTLRDKHVKYFIAELQNFDEVMDHAQQFTQQVNNKSIPFVDTEPIEYSSENYGTVNFLKVATQMHDAEGRQRGWSVSLMIRNIDWKEFERDLSQAAGKDKLWSVYSSCYDRVLLNYKPYMDLIKDVIAVVPAGRHSVADLGAGTGNVSKALLSLGYTVTAVENNLGMIERLRSKHLSDNLTVVKASLDNLSTLADNTFDAVVMVNVLYAVDDPLACLRDARRILKASGRLGFSTTHSESDFNKLLKSIKAACDTHGNLDEDYQVLYDINRAIERDVAKRHTREEYREWVKNAGFEIIRDVPNTYEDALMLIHAKRK